MTARKRRARIEPISRDDPEADLLEAIAVEHRRTIAWIRFAEAQINALETDRDLVWGVGSTSASSEHSTESSTGTDAGEDRDVETVRTLQRHAERFDARISQWIEILNWNRRHLLDITTKMLAHGVDVRRLQLDTVLVDGLVGVIDFVLRELGRDPADPATRAIVRKAFDSVDLTRSAQLAELPAAPKTAS